jgi:hypothetical protein
VYEEKLSEEAVTLDNFGGSRGKAVKKTKELRQVWVHMKKSCQENAGIKTGLESNEKKLSRKRRNHDRFGTK